MTRRQPLARHPSPIQRRGRRRDGRLPAGRGLRFGRFFRAGLGAGCICMMIAGCSAAPQSDRHPIDGLRMIGNDEPPAAKSSEEQGELERLDLRV